MKRILIALAGLTAFGVILAKQPNYTPAQNGHQSHQLPCEMCGINPRIPGKSLCKECERIALADQHKETALKQHKGHNKASEDHKKKGKTKHAHADQPKKKTPKPATIHKPPKTHVTKPPKPPKTIPSPVYGPFLPGQWPQIPAPPPKHHKPKVPVYGPTKP